jgi:polysaccharide export outer membrane protein
MVRLVNGDALDRIGRGLLKLTVIALPCFALAGCDLLASDGPNANNVLAGASERRKPDPASFERFALVGVDGKIASDVERFYRPLPTSVPSVFRGEQAFGLLGVGDLLRISIWEVGAPAGGLFNREGKGGGGELTVRVEADGTIPIPYGGRVVAAGRSVAATERAVEQRLKDKAVDPQVTIFVAEPVSGSVSVQGEVAKPGLAPLVKPGARILDAVALAGGSKFPPYETNLRLTRGNATLNIGLQGVIEEPEIYNVRVGGGDALLLTRATRKFVALGAVLKPGDQLFLRGSLTLSDAMGLVIGLDSQRSDAKAVFIFRREPVELAQQWGSTLASQGGEKAGVPTVYQVDLKDPRSFFVLSSFPVRPNDILYVSTAPLADVAKFMQIISGATATVAIPRTLFGNYPSSGGGF